MIKHIVMWKLKEQAAGNTKKANAIKMKQLLEGLTDKIEAIVELEVGINDIEYNASNFDIVLITVFNNYTDLDLYQNHPAHLEVVTFVKEITEHRSAVDYIL